MATSIVIHLKTCTPVGHDAGIDRWPEGFGIDIFLRRSHVSVPPRLEVLPLSLSLSWFVPIFLNSIAVPWVYKCIVGNEPLRNLPSKGLLAPGLSRTCDAKTPRISCRRLLALPVSFVCTTHAARRESVLGAAVAMRGPGENKSMPRPRGNREQSKSQIWFIVPCELAKSQNVWHILQQLSLLQNRRTCHVMLKYAKMVGNQSLPFWINHQDMLLLGARQVSRSPLPPSCGKVYDCITVSIVKGLHDFLQSSLTFDPSLVLQFWDPAPATSPTSFNC